MPSLRLVNIVKIYGKSRAIDNLSLMVEDGELVTLLGPSGCGKTTTLRAIIGFVPLESGDIYIGDRKISDIPPEKRGVGLVFQNYALWPHMTVFQNLAFGLQLKKMSKNQIRKKVTEGLSIVKLEGLESRYPRQLSGGQQQRVTARAWQLHVALLVAADAASTAAAGHAP